MCGTCFPYQGPQRHLIPIDKFLHHRRMIVAGAHARSYPFRMQARAPHRPVSGESMNKADLVDRIAGACSISKAQATTAIDTAVDSICLLYTSDAADE